MEQSLAIIPKPNQMTLHTGAYTLTGEAGIAYPQEAEHAARQIRKLTGLDLSGKNAGVRLELNPDILGEEAYRLDVNGRGICFAAATPAGLFYGAQTLRQLLPVGVETGEASGPFEIPYVHIEDAPRYAHRGFLFDVARYFFGVDEIKRMIDLLALQKMNRFHWHLTDDQGWRIEIKRYPRLTEIGSKRSATQVGGFLLTKPVYDGKPHAGFYTQDEVREVVAYARANFIEVIPEIDAPGHSVAALAAYPELSCTGAPAEVRTSVGAFSRPLCAGKEFVFEFLANVFSEVAELFPYKHIHIGGDEVKKSAWKRCPHCQARIKANGLKNEHELQTYFENRLVKILKSIGCQATVWSEALNNDLDKDVINQYWFFPSKKKTVAGLKNGRKTIISDFSSYYLDYPHRLIPLIQSYTFEPQYPELTAEQAENILGVEAALWTEFVHLRGRADWQTFPRLAAISETAWTAKEGRDYADFVGRLGAFEKRLAALGVQTAAPECYLRYQKIPKVPCYLKLLFSKEHPATVEYNRYR